MAEQPALAFFHPLIRRWFAERYGAPTDIQAASWPPISRGEHVLVTAPTGSGKTLTGFLWALNQLVTGALMPGAARVLYVSPLKALNNDIQRNLLTPLAELKAVFESAGEAFTNIRVLTRSGDTPQEERRRMQRHPPEILITTPESLNLLLSSKGGRGLLTSVETLILDEIHDVFSSHRGVHLITAVDRLVRLSGEFQRIAISATVNPLDEVAAFVGGSTLANDIYTPRPVRIVRARDTKQIELRVRCPRDPQDVASKDRFWEPLADEFRRIIQGNRSTLIFTNGRRLSEQLTALINEGTSEPLAYAHHGSLSKEIRLEVERRLKAGELKGIIATATLELGIDIGSLDEVILVSSPPSISSAIQRIGRAGHSVGEVSRGQLIPTHAHDFLEAAVLTDAISRRDLEPRRPIENPLDVLAQILISMTGTETWDIDDLYGFIRTSFPYRNLSRRQFDLVLEMLGGRYADTRIRGLKPRIAIDRGRNTVTARQGALYTLYSAGGTIPDRGYFQLRHAASSAKIGELDEEFVWEATVGQVFALGSQHWRVERITHNDVFVLPAQAGVSAPPFWRNEQINRDWHFSERIGEFLAHADDLLARSEHRELIEELESRHRFDNNAACALTEYLGRQRTATGTELPHRRHLLVERIQGGPDGYDNPAGNCQTIVHTMWGGQVNRPFALALSAALESQLGPGVEVQSDNDAVMVQAPESLAAEDILSIVTSANLDQWLREALESSGFFGARFRECAGRALLLPKRRIGQRQPLWMTRLMSKKLMATVRQHPDFPILLETWRTCLQDELAPEVLRELLAEIESGAIRWSEFTSPKPSPFAAQLAWEQINEYMYADDTPQQGSGRSALKDDLIREAVFDARLRPAIASVIVDEFEAKRQCLYPGYAPTVPLEITEWIKERVVIPLEEWNALAEAIDRDGDAPLIRAEDLCWLTHDGNRLLCARDVSGVLREQLYTGYAVTAFDDEALELAPIDDERDEAQLLGELLSFYGPRTLSALSKMLSLPESRLERALEELVDEQAVIMGELVKDDSDTHYCDAENFEILIRMQRAALRGAFQPRALATLPGFLAQWQGLASNDDGPDALAEILERLRCLPLAANQWEADVLPARLRHYNSGWLDTLLEEGSFCWLGTDTEQLVIADPAELPLMKHPDPETSDGLAALFRDPHARYGFFQLQDQAAELRADELAERLWCAVWQGRVTNDGFAAMRRGLEQGFRLDAKAASRAAARTSRRRAAMRSFGYPGNWYLLHWPERDDDAITTLELKKDRTRVLLDRYGVVFRELLARELPEFRWSQVLPALKIMELAGEVVGGHFFEDIPGIQFASHRALRAMERPRREHVHWMNAQDPASVAGLGLSLPDLPRRAAGNHLVYRGDELVLISESRGRELTIRLAPGDPDLQVCFAPLEHLLTRRRPSLTRIELEHINGEPASTSEYLDALSIKFLVANDHKGTYLERKL
ncbi:MAG: DEAD/DEAH box helicase [Gammaproteobacteria bacterium]|nr:DEAD/DEAH box helicase [Gammaproteobacteria bacterium]